MAEKKEKKRGSKHGRSLNSILLLSFILLAVVVVFLYLLLQSVLAGRQYSDRIREGLRSASGAVDGYVREASSPEDETLRDEIAAAAYAYGVSVYLVYPQGKTVYTYAGATRPFDDFDDVSAIVEEAEGTALFLTEEDYVSVTRTSLDGVACYLYVAAPLEPLVSYVEGFRWISVITALVALALAFAASILMAFLITKPVTEVANQAKELARGNYDFRVRKDYFCSEIRELSHALDGAREEISKADTMQKELIANVSHDFKTPLTMIKAYASMIIEISGDNKKKRDEHAAIIIEESDRLAALVSDLLDLSKLRAGVDEEEQTVFDLSAEVFSVAARFDYLRETGGYSIETEVEPGLATRASRVRVQQVLYNLIGNAVNYTGSDRRVRVRLYAKEDAARFEVIDSGKGIPPDELDRIWDRYYRTESSHKRPVGGTGLGLSIVKNILLSRGIPFGVISEEGKGSCFWVEFPTCEAPEGGKL